MKFPQLKRLIQRITFCVPVAVAFLDCVAYVARVEGISMQPVLNPEQKTHDYVLLNKWSIRDFNINRGDIVALISPRNPEQKIIKRVIATEGDVVKTRTYKKRYMPIPQGHCWVEGDHHAHSMDSNFFGPVAVGLITAKASHIVWPPSRWRKLYPELPENRIPSNPSYYYYETEDDALEESAT
ncbi:mitochondrial inner membrane protease subunit 2 [Centruroides vittatus]|uniref:mitochondrial inner membrane protease subunit 2 n=1 Tax=Centruroides vittatus TaxID=120091 RepID=UPI00350FCC11